MEDLIRLNLGAAHSRIKGFLSVDLDESTKPDISAGLDTLPFDSGSVTTIYASHVLEHYMSSSYNLTKRGRLLQLLKYWHSLLTPNGELYIGVPDIEQLIKIYQEAGKNIQIQEYVFDALYGGHRNPYDFHYFGFSKSYLSFLLKEAGFSDVTEFEPFAEDETKHKIEGQFISLNLRARKSHALQSKESCNFESLQATDELSIFKKAAEERLRVIEEQAIAISHLKYELQKIPKPLTLFYTFPKRLIAAFKHHYMS